MKIAMRVTMGPSAGEKNVRRSINILFALLVVVLLGACATARGGSKSDKLYEAQNAFSGAVRWGDFEGAWGLVEPKYREEHPMTQLQLARYGQIQVSGYRDIGSSTFDDGTAVRDIEIGVVNRHTLAERSMRYRERWHWDEAQKRWWLQSGLPDFWEGE